MQILKIFKKLFIRDINTINLKKAIETAIDLFDEIMILANGYGYYQLYSVHVIKGGTVSTGQYKSRKTDNLFTKRVETIEYVETIDQYIDRILEINGVKIDIAKLDYDLTMGMIDILRVERDFLYNKSKIQICDDPQCIKSTINQEVERINTKRYL